MATSYFDLRPCVTSARVEYLKQCTFIDCYLFNKGGALLYVMDVRNKGKGNAPSPCQRLAYSITRDAFGLFGERVLYALPHDIGAPVTVDHLSGLNHVQRLQLRRLLILLAMSARASLRAGKCSTRIHPLTPRALDPFDGIRNQYATTGRAARDNTLARRAMRANSEKQNDGV